MNNNPLSLSKRLHRVSDYLPKGARFADIGSDHAYLPCYVCQQDDTAVAIAGEINEGPFESAVKNVKKHALTDRITVKQGNGLEVITEADHIKQVVIAGMGGSLITDILDDGKDKLQSVELLILQPNIDARSIRRWLVNHQFILKNEELVKENGHIYEILVASQTGTTPYSRDTLTFQKELLFGPFLLHQKSSIFIEKWSREASKLEKIITQMKQAKAPDNLKIKQFTEELTWIKEELNRA